MLPEICLGLRRARHHRLRGAGRRRLRRRASGTSPPAATAAAAACAGMVQRSMSPVWEANHVWLIFVLVIVWTAFPVAFGSIFVDAARPALPRRARDHLPRHGVRAARPGGDDPRGARARRGVRALLRARPVLPRRGARRHRLGPRAGGQRGRRRRDVVAEPDLDRDRRARRADGRLHRRRLPGRRRAPRRAARPRARRSAPARSAPASSPGRRRSAALLVRALGRPRRCSTA